MRIKPGYALVFFIFSLVVGAGIGSYFKKTPSVLVVQCPDGFRIEIQGEFDLKSGHRMRLVFCEQQENKPNADDPLSGR